MGRSEQDIAADLDLVKRCLADDRLAQERFYNLYKGRMMAVCTRYMGNRELAADVFQEAYIKAFRLLSNWRGDGPLEAWLRRIMVSTALNELRKKKLAWLEEVADGFVLSPQFNSAMSHLSEQELLRMIAALPPGYRTVFNLYVIEGYDHKEIAEMLGVSDATSRSQLMKARVLLQKRILESDPSAVERVHKMRS
jgi:RNA polymerase sigma-70 factor (ECF subfamily)